MHVSCITAYHLQQHSFYALCWTLAGTLHNQKWKSSEHESIWIQQWVEPHILWKLVPLLVGIVAMIPEAPGKAWFSSDLFWRSKGTSFDGLCFPNVLSNWLDVPIFVSLGTISVDISWCFFFYAETNLHQCLFFPMCHELKFLGGRQTAIGVQKLKVSWTKHCNNLYNLVSKEIPYHKKTNKTIIHPLNRHIDIENHHF